MNPNEISRTDKLALARTRLANERTFLAYFRTAVVFLSSGFVILKIDALEKLVLLGCFFIVMAAVVFTVGVARFFFVKKQLAKYFK